MKTMKPFLFTLLIVAFIGCNNTNRDRTDDIDNDEVELEDNSDVMDMDDTYNANNGSVTNDRIDMYRQLNMTPEQIQRFENENPNFGDSIGNTQWKRNATIDNSLRNILSDDQYRQYETWMENRNRNNNNSNTNTNTNNQQ